MSNSNTQNPTGKIQLPHRLLADGWWLIGDHEADRRMIRQDRKADLAVIDGGIKEVEIDRHRRALRQWPIRLVR